jgi:hypothetical protein
VHTPLPAASALFVEECNFQCLALCSPEKPFIAQNKNFPQKRHSFIAQNQTFSAEKNVFFATRKDMESYSQMRGKRIALEFSNFPRP